MSLFGKPQVLDNKGRIKLKVRGEDQLFSYAGPLALRRTVTISGAGGYIETLSPTAGTAWVVTNVSAQDRGNATTAHYYHQMRGANEVTFHREITAFATSQRSEWNGLVFIDEADVIRVSFVGALLNDSCRVDITGYVMTME